MSKKNILLATFFIFSFLIIILVSLQKQNDIKKENNSTKEQKIKKIPLSYDKIDIKNYPKIFKYLKNKNFVSGILVFKDYKHLVKNKDHVTLVFHGNDKKEKFLKIASGLILSKKSKYFIIKYFYKGKNEQMDSYVTAIKLENKHEIYLENGIFVN